MQNQLLIFLGIAFTTTTLAPSTTQFSAQDIEQRDAVAQDVQPKISRLAIDTSVEYLPGMLRPRDSVELGAPLDAPILELLKAEGQQVRKGEAIARLDDRVAVASMNLARHEAAQTAAVDRAQLVVARAERVLQQTISAFDRGAANDEELTDARTELAIAQSELKAAIEAQTAAILRERQAAAHVERHVIRAPFDGVVVRLPEEAGAVVQVGETVAEVASPRSLRVDLYLPSTTAVDVRRGGRYALELHEPTSRVLWGIATYIEPRIEPTSGTVRITFDLELINESVLAGTLVTPAKRVPTPEEIAFAQNGVVATTFAAHTDAP